LPASEGALAGTKPLAPGDRRLLAHATASSCADSLVERSSLTPAVLEPLRRRDFRLLWVAGLVSVLGDWMLLAALPFHVYERTGSALAAGSLFIAYALPGVLLGSVAGVFVDRWDRRRTMLVANVLRAGIVLLLLANPPDSLWPYYAVVFAEAAFGQFFAPAENALLPRLVGEEHLMAANSLNALNDNLGRLIGPALGGVVLAGAGFAGVVVADGASYLIAALLILLLKAPAAVPAEEGDAPIRADAAEPQARRLGSDVRRRWTAFWADWRAGLRRVGSDAVLRGVFVVLGLALFADGIVSALLVAFVQDEMRAGSAEFGWMLTSRGAGGLAGGVLVAQMARAGSPAGWLGWGLAATGAALLAIFNVPRFPLALGLLVLAGVATVAWFAGAQTILQTRVEDAYRGRVFGALGATTTLVALLGMAAGGLAGDGLGVVLPLNVAGAAFVGAGLVAVVLLVRSRPPAAVNARQE
jgi:predicted MFS family arabinose efflux permease